MSYGRVLLRAFEALSDPRVLAIEAVGAMLQLLSRLALVWIVVALGYAPARGAAEPFLTGQPLQRGGLVGAVLVVSALVMFLSQVLVGSLTRGASLHAIGSVRTGRVSLLASYQVALKAWGWLMIPAAASGAIGLVSLMPSGWLEVENGLTPVAGILLLLLLALGIAIALWAKVAFCDIAVGSQTGRLHFGEVNDLVRRNAWTLVATVILLGILAAVTSLAVDLALGLATSWIPRPSLARRVSLLLVSVAVTTAGSTLLDGGLVSVYRQIANEDTEEELPRLTFEADGIPVGMDGLPHPELTGMPAEEDDRA